ncbi:unnamed protein product [Prorocentrum cordatum]|uniref:Methyltransferase FkbM domain-containing protein n=1 Tax=Prorocentrum cordatum TaxID=2364126 RepID=A0ABN9QF77_9DINO|nr:unnamed protein product [Polarella glacialis]
MPPSAMARWDLIAYLVRYAGPSLEANLKTEADTLLPYLALGLLRGQEYGPWYNPLVATEERVGTPVVLDVGAYDGDFASEVLRTMARVHDPPRSGRRLKQEVRLVSVEPHPAAFQELRERAQASGWGDSAFCALNVALSSEAPGRRQRLVAPRGHHGSRQAAHLARAGEAAAPGEEEVEVEVLTADGLFAEGRCGLRPSQPVFLLKVDCEGHDGRVLRGAGRLLAEGTVKYVLFEHMGGYDSEGVEPILDLLWGHGYGCFFVLDRLLVPVSGGWFHHAWRDRTRGGLVFNVDVLCARPRDRDLRALVEGYVTHGHAARARDVVLRAVEDWKEAQQPEPRAGGVRGLHALDSKMRLGSNDPAAGALFAGDLLRHGYGASPSRVDLRRALGWFRRAAGATGDTALGRSWAVEAAAVEVGTCFHFGDCGAPRDLDLAAAWYSKAASIWWPSAHHSNKTSLHAGTPDNTQNVLENRAVERPRPKIFNLQD